MTNANNKSTTVMLGEPLNAFIAQQIDTGRFGNTSEVVRAALRLFEERENKLAVLRAAIEEGRRSPIVKDFSFSKLREEIENEAKARTDGR